MMAPVPGNGVLRLAALLADGVAVPAALDVPVEDLVMDHREARPGAVFFARRGARVDGARFAASAAARGAVAMVCSGEGPPRREGALVRVPVADVAVAAGRAAHRFFGRPSEALDVVAVTGTNGKTSVSHFVARALERHAGRPVGLLGTLGRGVGGTVLESGLTTPDCISVHRAMADFVAAGAVAAVMEASSHALVQRRLAGLRVRTAVFTNLSRDHLDYHGDMAAYAAAKARLFAQPGLRAAVINASDAFAPVMRAALASDVEVLDFSLVPGTRASVTGTLREAGAGGLELTVDGPGGVQRIRSALIGQPAAWNLLAAYAVLLVHGVGAGEAARLLEGVRPVPGRMQPLRREGGALVVIDYAHTPAALEAALASLRPLCAGRLWCVFGAGGERDPGKRPLMGAAAAALADRVIVTDDNPRREDGDRIVDAIRDGVPRDARAAVAVERDRGRAIALAVRGALPGDVVLVAGKGHECWQEVGGERRPFSDAAAVRAAWEHRA
jgi:UDP-N-acetylmuramoyl-L-alanyl-D-glutamate--2,6-diaminopimelate ligase